MRHVNDNSSGVFFTLDFINSLQKQISQKIARFSNREYASRKNDLALCLKNKDICDKLEIYNEILEEIKWCNKCFHCFKPEDVVFAIKMNLNKLN